jgi:SAM-dependent methyltransferase
MSQQAQSGNATEAQTLVQPDNSKIPAKPAEMLQQMITGFFSTCLIYVAAQLRIADHLAAGPLTAGELAANTETRVEPLRRVLRGLAAFGLLQESTEDLFELTDIGAYLRADVPLEQRTWALLWGHEMFPRAWGDLLHVLKTGEIPFDHIFGQPFFDYLDAHQEISDVFNAALGALGRREHEAVLAKYNFGAYKRIVDVGGGTGAWLAAICGRYPTIEGVVFDLPSAKSGAEQTFRAAGLDTRCRFVAGNFFEATPPACDLVVLAHILHDWDDKRAAAILRNCERAIEPAGRLLVIDQVMAPAPNRQTRAVMADLHMLATLPGRERSESEFRELLASAGLRLQTATATNSPLWLLEAARPN